MNRDHIVGRLKQINRKIKEQWCNLHNDRIGVIAAKRNQIAGRAQALCGIVRQESDRQLDSFKNDCRSWRLTESMLPMQLVQHRKPTQQNRETHAALASVKA